MLTPLESTNVTLTWWEDGTYVASFPANHTYHISAVAAVNYPANAHDNDTTNNEVTWGNMIPQGPLIGDVKIDGWVNILDSIVLGLVFGSKQGDPNWHPECDLQPNKKIDILDSIVVGLNFQKFAPGPQYPIPCG
jgi:hypothetical protein